MLCSIGLEAAYAPSLTMASIVRKPTIALATHASMDTAQLKGKVSAKLVYYKNIFKLNMVNKKIFVVLHVVIFFTSLSLSHYILQLLDKII